MGGMLKEVSGVRPGTDPVVKGLGLGPWALHPTQQGYLALLCLISRQWASPLERLKIDGDPQMSRLRDLRRDDGLHGRR